MSLQNSSVELVAAEISSAKKTRRARGDGGLRFEAKRSLWIATVPRPGQGPKTLYGKTQAEALAKKKAYLADLASGRIDDSVRAERAPDLQRNPTLGEWLDYWLDNDIKPVYNADGQRESGKQPTTHENYAWIAGKHVLPYPIAQVRLDKLTVAHVEAWWAALGRKGVGMPSRHKAYVVLTGAITRVLERRDVSSLAMNPVRVFGAGDRVVKPTARKKVAPTPQGTRALYAAAAGERLALVLDLGIRLGLRRQEMTSLRFGDFDLARGTLTLRRRVNRLKAQGVTVRDGTKTGRDESVEQVVPISNPQQWAQLLEAHKQKVAMFAAEHKKTWVGAEPTSAWGYLFPTRTGGVMDPNEIFRWFKDVAARAGQPDKTLHSLRHDCATLGIESGMSLWEVSKLLRHASTNITESVYGHITGAHETKLFSTVDRAIDAQLGAQDAAASG